MKKLLIITALLASGCSTMSAETRFVTSNAVDVGSTALALTRDGISEGNPLGVGGMLAAKVAVYGVAKAAGGDVECGIYKAAPIFDGAAANNLLLFLGYSAGAAISGGALVAAYQFLTYENECGVSE